MKEITMQEFDELLSGDKPVVCDFYATWCGPCKMLAPVMDSVSEKFDGKAEFVKVDIDKNEQLAIRYGIMSIPYVAVFKGGALTAKTLGYMNEKEATAFVEKNV